MTAQPQPWTSGVIAKWQAWRNADHADNALISRSDIIALLTEITRLKAERDELLERCVATRKLYDIGIRDRFGIIEAALAQEGKQ